MLLHRQILASGDAGGYPTALVAIVEGYVVSLHAKFDEIKDDYDDVYHVELWRNARPQDICLGAYRPWHYERLLLGTLPFTAVTFDRSRRKSLQSAKLEALVQAYKASEPPAHVVPSEE